MQGNTQSQRSTAVLNIGDLAAATTTDVTFAAANAAYNTATPNLTDRVILNPQAALAAGVVFGGAFVSAAGVITARFTNTGTASVAGGTAVNVNVELIKATGSI